VPHALVESKRSRSHGRRENIRITVTVSKYLVADAKGLAWILGYSEDDLGRIIDEYTWPTVLLAAKTYGKGVLNPLFSRFFARVRAACQSASNAGKTRVFITSPRMLNP
jgi:hypothetical protein